MGNVVNANNSEPIPISSLNLQEIIKKNEEAESDNNCEYTTKFGECDANGIQTVYPIITKNPSKNGKQCPSEYTQKCKSSSSLISFVSFIHKLRIPKQKNKGSKLFIFNLNNPLTVLLKYKSYVSIELNSFSLINFQCISISINGNIFPITSSIESNNKGIFKYNFFVSYPIKIEPNSIIVLNLFFWNTEVNDTFYNLKIDFNKK